GVVGPRTTEEGRRTSPETNEASKVRLQRSSTAMVAHERFRRSELFSRLYLRERPTGTLEVQQRGPGSTINSRFQGGGLRSTTFRKGRCFNFPRPRWQCYAGTRPY